MFRRLFLSVLKRPQLATLLAPTLISYVSYQSVKTQELPILQNPSNEPIMLNQKIFFDEILGNRTKFFFLVVFKDNEREALKAAKALSNHNINVYVISRPSLNEVQKIVSRVKGFSSLAEENQQEVEIYLKTTYSDEYMFIDYKRNFYEKQEKLSRKLKGIMNMFKVVQTPEQLVEVMQENYYKLDAPLIFKSFATKTKPQQKSLKFFKRGCFNLIERRLLSLDSQFVILSEGLAKRLSLDSGEIIILRNDILQKYQDAVVTEVDGIQSLHTPLTLAQYSTPEQYLDFLKQRGEKQSLYKQGLKYSDYQEPFTQLILPRVGYLKTSSRNNVTKLLRSIQNSRDKDQLVLSLQLNDCNKENMHRIVNFFKLQQELQSEKLAFMISQSQKMEDLMPHLNPYHSAFTLFNIFNQIKNDSQKIIHKRVVYPYEKHFLKDPQNYLESYEELRKQIYEVLAMPLELRLQKTDYISYSQDKIKLISGFQLGDLLKSQHPAIIHVKIHGMVGNAISQALIDIQKEHNFNVYQVYGEQQIFDQPLKENLLLFKQNENVKQLFIDNVNNLKHLILNQV